jgi:hypothetical protein
MLFRILTRQPPACIAPPDGAPPQSMCSGLSQASQILPATGMAQIVAVKVGPML